MKCGDYEHAQKLGVGAYPSLGKFPNILKSGQWVLDQYFTVSIIEQKISCGIERLFSVPCNASWKRLWALIFAPLPQPAFSTPEQRIGTVKSPKITVSG